MLSFVREKDIVWIKVETDLANNVEDEKETNIYFQLKCHSTQHADLLLRYLRKRLDDRIKTIREKEFFSGWKHGTAKKRGKKWFNYFMQLPSLKPRETHP